MAAGVVFALSLILVVGHLQEGPGSLAKTFTFPEYPYKETTKNELLFRQFEQACEESGACKMLSQHRSDSVAKTRCIRECVSPSCYKEIYLFDQLEEGEIDVRLNSFKGCFMQRNGRPRNDRFEPSKFNETIRLNHQNKVEKNSKAGKQSSNRKKKSNSD